MNYLLILLLGISSWHSGLQVQANENFINRDPGPLDNPSEAYGLLGPLISNLLGLALFAGALVAFVFFILGAIKWGTAGSGDGAEQGRKTMLYAGIGLVMLGLVYVVIIIYNAALPSA